MSKRVLASLFLTATLTAHSESIAVKDNTDVQLTLSGSNYNRLLINQDKIVEAVFPEGAMALKSDEQDGSVYILLNRQEPFTLFLTTEAGRHFSLTLSGEESLGKTIELKPERSPTPAALKKAVVEAKPNGALDLLEAMKTKQQKPGVSVGRVYGQAIRLSRGLTLLPREQWKAGVFSGEALEIYNGGNEPLTLSSSDFITEDVKAISLSQATIPPKGRAMLYRVSEVAHG